MKGDNIIEAYCKICGKKITAFDLRAGYAEKLCEEYVHIQHLPRARVLMQSDNVLKALREMCLEMDKHPDADVGQKSPDFYESWKSIAHNRSIPDVDAQYIMKVVISEARCSEAGLSR